MILTILNTALAVGNFLFTLLSYRQSQKQIALLREQIDVEKQPDFGITTHIDGIQHALYSIRDEITKLRK